MCSLCTFTDTCVNTAQVLDGACIMYTEYTLHMCRLYQIKCLILGSSKKNTKTESRICMPMRILQ
jgi:hypothetical protein